LTSCNSQRQRHCDHHHQQSSGESSDPGVPEDISEALDRIGRDASIKAVVLIGGGRTFVAGAGIKEFGKMSLASRAPPDFFLCSWKSKKTASQ
jgi:enoyl-CoA hydratase/carnithine racemase